MATRNRREKVAVALALTGAITAFNLVAVFGVEPLLHDDAAHYQRILHGRTEQFMTRFNPLLPGVEWPAYKLMAWSAPLTRLATVLWLMVPISWLLFTLYRRHVRMPPLAAFTAAVLPNISPHQWQIPAGINMSYVLWGFLPLLASLLCGLDYVRSPKLHARAWIPSLLLFTVSMLIMEQSAFLAIPVLYIVWRLGGQGARRRRLVSALGAIALLRVIHILLSLRISALMPSAEIGRNLMSALTMARLEKILQWSLPVPVLPGWIIPSIIAIILLGSAWKKRTTPQRSISKMTDLPENGRSHHTTVAAFFSLWLVCTVPVFVIGAKWFSPRYAYLPSVAILGLLVWLTSRLGCRIENTGRRLLNLFFVSVLLISGIGRIARLTHTYAPLNENFRLVRHTLASRELPRSAQIVIVGMTGVAGGIKRSSGYLQYALNRSDISGLIGSETSPGSSPLFDRFDPRTGKNAGRQFMAGISLQRPLFMFRREGPGLTQLAFVVHWQDEGPEAAWTLYRSDPRSGRLSTVTRGVGLAEYCQALAARDKMAVSQKDILWGDLCASGETHGPN